MNAYIERWRNLNPWIKWGALGVILALLLFLSIKFFTPNNSVVLYSNLDAKDQQAITTELAKMGVNYTEDPETKSISVQKSEVSRARMELASQGLPSSGNPGFELFDQSTIGTTQFDKDRKLERALKGQIENDLIKGVDVIERATVQLSLSTEKSIFEESENSKATIIVGLKRGTELSETQIKGIQHFVSGAVKNLKPEDVVVLNEMGEDLTAEISDGTIASTSGMNKQLQIVQQTEDRIKRDIEKSLYTIYGKDSVTVNVRANINFDEVVRNIESYDDKNKALVSKNENKETTKKIDDATVDEVGTETNGDVPDYETEQNKNNDGKTVYVQDKNQVIENYDVSKTMETIKQNPALTNLSVSVYVDDTKAPDTTEELTDLENSIALSAGIVDTDNDGKYDNGQVKVTKVMFSTKANNNPVEDASSGSSDFASFLKNKSNVVWMIVIVMMGVLIIAIVSWTMYQRKEREEENRLFGGFEGNTIGKTSKGSFIDHQGQMIGNEGDLEGSIPSLKKETSNLSGSLDSKLMENIKQRKEEDEDDFDLEIRKNKLAENANKAATDNPQRTAEYIKKLINEG